MSASCCGVAIGIAVDYAGHSPVASIDRSAEPDLSALLVAGTDALSCGEWEDARHAFERALALQEDAHALEGLGLAAWWLDLTATVFDARERAYRLYRERGETRAAARVAVWLGWDYAAFRGEPAVARGWFGLARELLADDTTCAEFAWLSVREGVAILFEEGNLDLAAQHAVAAIAAARAAGSRDYELLALAVQGLASVTAGRVDEGMRQLDGVSAALIAGEMTDRVSIGTAGCYLITACDRVRDYGRAAQWCARIKAYCAKWGLRPLFAVCRTQYAAVCIWHGEWAEAERELVTAVDELSVSRPAMTAEGAARLGELRRRQGRLDEAQSFFDRAKSHPMAKVGRAALALDRDDAATAADLAERYLRGVHPQNRTERVSALELVVRAKLALVRLPEAKAAVDELESIAAAVATPPLSGTARLCRGLVAFADGEIDEARRACEDAVDHFERSAATYEGARARLALAGVLHEAGRGDAAVREAVFARDTFEQLQAAHDRARADRTLAQFDRSSPGSAGSADVAGALLSRRELDVLRLIARGLSNQRVAEQLFISEHTVHRHVANMFGKLGVSSRSAAVAQALRLGLIEH